MIFRRSFSDPFRRELPAACFDPGTAALIALQAVGTGLSIAGQSQRAGQEAAQANYMAQVARRQQEIAERNARFAEQQGAAEEDRSRLKTTQIAGTQRAQLAAQGADINSGSLRDILGDTAQAGEFDVQAIRNNTAQRKYSALLQADDAASRVSGYDVQGANALANLPYGIGSSLLGAASGLAGRWRPLQAPAARAENPGF